MTSDTKKRPVDAEKKATFPQPTVSQLEEALEERTRSDRRENADASTDVIYERRVKDRRDTEST